MPVLPIFSISPSWMTRRSFTWADGDSSDTSSRKTVPLFATSNSPSFMPSAPVKEPFSYPNSSLSISSCGMLPQLIGTNFSYRLRLFR